MLRVIVLLATLSLVAGAPSAAVLAERRAVNEGYNTVSQQDAFFGHGQDRGARAMHRVVQTRPIQSDPQQGPFAPAPMNAPVQPPVQRQQPTPPTVFQQAQHLPAPPSFNSFGDDDEGLGVSVPPSASQQFGGAMRFRERRGAPQQQQQQQQQPQPQHRAPQQLRGPPPSMPPEFIEEQVRLHRASLSQQQAPAVEQAPVYRKPAVPQRVYHTPAPEPTPAPAFVESRATLTRAPMQRLRGAVYQQAAPQAQPRVRQQLPPPPAMPNLPEPPIAIF